MTKKVFVLNGNEFSNLEEFAANFGKVVLLSFTWNGNLNVLDDILDGWHGTPKEGFIIHWKNSALSKERLNKEFLPNQTLFETLIGIIESHQDDGIELVLL